MVEVREAPAGDQSWLDDWQARLHEWYGKYSPDPQWVRDSAGKAVKRWTGAPARHTFTLHHDGEPVGHLALAEMNESSSMMIIDLWIAPQHRRRGLGRAALTWAQEWTRPRAQKLSVIADAGDPAVEALFAALPARAILMIKALPPKDSAIQTGAGPAGEEPLPPSGSQPGPAAGPAAGPVAGPVAGPAAGPAAGPGAREPLPPGGSQPPQPAARPMAEAEYEPWVAVQQAGYIDEIVGAGLGSREEVEPRAREQFAQLLPDGLATRDQSLLCVEAEGQVVGTMWVSHHYAPACSFVLGVDVAPAHRGKGYGRVAMRAGEQASLASGDSHLALNVFAQNTVAIGLYRSMGYVMVQKVRSLVLGS